MYRTRGNYWSCSNFAKWIRKAFNAPEKPESLSIEQWAVWDEDFKQSHRVTYWIVEQFLDKLQDIVNFPIDALDNIRYYCKARFVERTHLISTHLPKGQIYSFHERALPGMFEALVDHVEVEKAHEQWAWGDGNDVPFTYKNRWTHLLRWKSIRSKEAGLKYLMWESNLCEDESADNDGPLIDHMKSQAAVAKETIELYMWWTTIRPYRPDADEVSGWAQYVRDRTDKHSGSINHAVLGLTPEDKAEVRRLIDLTATINQTYAYEDEQMLIRLVKLRTQMWL